MSTPIVGLIMGIIFGASVVLAGLTDPDKIIGALRLKDFHALRTIVVFVLVGMLGTWLLGFAGAANLKIEPAAILALLLGGALVGIGLGLSGYCPGTGLAALASGRIDALFTVMGMLFGAHVYVLIYPSIVVPLERILNFGPVTLPQITGTSAASWIVPAFITGAAVLLVTRPGRGTMDDRKTHDERNVSLAASSRPSIQTSPAFATGCLGTVRMFCRWKNFLFLIIVLCLLVLQASFWLVKAGYVGVDGNTSGNNPVAAGAKTQTNETAGQIVSDPREAAAAKIEVPVKLPWKPNPVAFDITFERVALLLRVTNAVLVLASVLYALVVFFGLTVSLGGRFRGLNHICQAFYFSLVALVLLLPWQAVSGSIVSGAIYTPGELAGSCSTNPGGTFGEALVYMRFTGYWVSVAVILVMAQSRSRRWSKIAVRKLKNAIQTNTRTQAPASQQSEGV
ncbi:MAG: DUF6691 family protein [Planctomycetota bacterium]